MLRNIKFRLSALAVLLLATSCLDKYPESAIPEKDAMKTFADAEQTLTGIYATFKSSSLFSGRLTLLPDIQADLVYAVEGNSNQFGNFWRWDVRPTDLDLEGVYADLYTVISRCNFFLERIDEVMRNEISDDNLEDLEEYTGEVYAIRALCYSELLKCFCEAYDPATAEQQQGVVLRTKYFEKEPVRRATLYDSYKFVLDDLTRADELLDEIVDRFGDPPKGVMNLIAIALLRARAAAAGITEITQKDGAILLSLATMDFAAISACCAEAQFKGRIFFSAGKVPMLSVKLKKGEDALKLATQLVGTYAAMRAQTAEG